MKYVNFFRLSLFILEIRTEKTIGTVFQLCILYGSFCYHSTFMCVFNVYRFLSIPIHSQEITVHLTLNHNTALF